LAAALRERWPAAAVGLTASGGGVFEVVVDGTLVFSKKALGRHPQPGEVIQLIAERTP
jgi:selT/selW/selH-like putative selenoprotein